MTTRTRYFMLGSFAILVAGLCTGLVAYYGGFPGVSAQSGPSELAYVPDSAAVVAYADVQEVMSSELRKRVHDVMPPDAEPKGQEEFKRQTGIDIEKDIDHIVAAVLPRATEDAGQPDAGFVAFRGRFDTVRLEGLAREHGGEVGDYKGKRLIVLKRMHEGDAAKPSDVEPQTDARPATRVRPTFVLAFAEPGLVMFGDEQTVRAAIDTATGGRSIMSNPEVMNLVKAVDNGANAWAVGRFDILASRAHLPEGMSAKIPAIKWFSAAGRVNGGISATLRAEARDDQAAQNLRDVLNGLMALARMQSDAKPEIQALMQTMALTGTGKTVELTFTVPSEILDTILKQHHVVAADH